MSRIVVVLIWLLHFLPLSILAPIGSGFGRLLYWVIVPRRKVVLINLRLCFPELSEAERCALAKRHFAVTGRSMLERGLAWWASAERLRATVRIDGLEHLQALKAAGRPVLLLAPHFVGLDMAGTRLSLEGDFVSVYSPQKDKVIDRWLHHGRSRFNDQLLLSRHDGVRATVKAMKSGRPLYYLPDLDYGRKESIFVPFFGVPAATLLAPSRMARMLNMVVQPVITELLPGGQGWRVRFLPALHDFPTADAEADAAHMNRFIEHEILKQPAQYLWVHRRFKTRPPGQSRFY